MHRIKRSHGEQLPTYLCIVSKAYFFCFVLPVITTFRNGAVVAALDLISILVKRGVKGMRLVQGRADP